MIYASVQFTFAKETDWCENLTQPNVNGGGQKMPTL